MVDSSYMEARPPGPGPLRRAWDQRMIPCAIDMAGSMEVALQRLSRRLHVPASAILGGLLGGAALLGLGLLARRRR